MIYFCLKIIIFNVFHITTLMNQIFIIIKNKLSFDNILHSVIIPAPILLYHIMLSLYRGHRTSVFLWLVRRFFCEKVMCDFLKKITLKKGLHRRRVRFCASWTLSKPQLLLGMCNKITQSCIEVVKLKLN